ncbi:DUF1963 domain-containing protein [Hyphomicrobium sp. CS1GBMeth3]|uniref:DUF1963 domain-containing protein n=1 Tax=Hyphomicrobium sp. CS1GBMeth3 TaxID=1892845 RepID=UPI000930BD11|nr:DUF1963 domain-containing protein [Hyphomicrobium sp. CS1GBMeth3]
MFDSPAEAAQALRAYFDPPRVELVVKALVPAIVLEPRSGLKMVLGGTRLGGTPDAPAGFVWPRPPAPADPEEIAKRGNEYAAREMRDHMALGLPYAFVAQIDLAEAAGLGDGASGIPTEGRLLFFYDYAVGPWETGTRPARVIWDRTPATDLTSLSMPEDLAAAATKERAARDAIAAQFPDREGESNKGVEKGTVYGAPGRAMFLRQTLRLPHPAALEINALPSDLAVAARGGSGSNDAEDFHTAYEEALEAHLDGYSGDAWRRNQLLGAPMPEQDDPRYDAVVVSEFGKQYLSREEWDTRRADILRKAEDWVLLLQVDLGNWMQERFVEGTVYFVIRKDDLAKRRFEQVVAVYQQT